MKEKNSKIDKNNVPKRFYKKWWFVLIIIIIIIILTVFIMICTFRNKLSPEETLSKFMYLIENKEYEKAKKLASRDIEHLDLLSNIEPSNLYFEFSDDKKSATSILEDKDLESTVMNVKLNKTILGWKVEDFSVETKPIDSQRIEDKLKNGDEISDSQLFYWAYSDEASKEEMSEYIKDNTIIAFIFAQAMNLKNYDKINEMYQPSTEKDLTVEKLKEYDWDNYEIIDTFKIIEGPKGDLTGTTIQLGDKKIYIYIAGGKIFNILEATI